jgi:Flp pilus assembly protein TadG
VKPAIGSKPERSHGDNGYVVAGGAVTREAFRMRIFRRLARDSIGAIALEMALIGPLFFLLMLTIVDLGLMLANQSLLEGAARDAARLIRTGQVQTATSPITTFQNLLCSDMSSMMTTAQCTANIIFEVQTFTSFGSVSFTPCVRNNNDTTGTGTACSFTAGSGGDIVGVKASYNRPFFVAWVGACLSGGSCWTGGTTGGSNPGTGSVSLVSTVIFRNEPFL